MKPLTIASVVLLAVAVMVAAGPSVHAITFYTLTVTADGHSATYKIIDRDDDGIVVLNTGNCGIVGQIQQAFGTTTFIFPGEHEGFFTINGVTHTVTLSSDDNFVLKVVC